MKDHVLNTTQKKIVVGVTGGIAAYKACDIVRELLRRGKEVKVVMTSDAQKFISPTTLAALSKNPVATDLFSSLPYGPIPHCDLAQEMDLLLVAPATAHTIGKCANGLADDLLTAIFLAARSPTLFAPAMNPAMYLNPMVQANIEALKKIGVFFIDPIHAEVACGQKGIGHLAPIEQICDKAEEILSSKATFQKKSFLITAGPTREFIDPVRFISNRSSGKMGFALAQAAQKRGASVTLISGHTSLPPPYGVSFVPIVTAEEMLTEIEKIFIKMDVVIMAAAVTDFRTGEIKKMKIKKECGAPEIHLEKTPDILLRLGGKKKKGQILIGFAAEDQDIPQNARQKILNKNLDFCVANDISQQGIGFESDRNEVTIIYASGEKKTLSKAEKGWIAERILDEIEALYEKGH